jgi:hypothetical protein
MTVLSKIERLLGRFAVPNLAYFLVAGQVAVYAAILFGKLDARVLILVPRLVMAGQWWRIFAFFADAPALEHTLHRLCMVDVLPDGKRA